MNLKIFNYIVKNLMKLGFTEPKAILIACEIILLSTKGDEK